jgi:hypothetical protein
VAAQRHRRKRQRPKPVFSSGVKRVLAGRSHRGSTRHRPVPVWVIADRDGVDHCPSRPPPDQPFAGPKTASGNRRHDLVMQVGASAVQCGPRSQWSCVATGDCSQRAQGRLQAHRSTAAARHVWWWPRSGTRRPRRHQITAATSPWVFKPTPNVDTPNRNAIAVLQVPEIAQARQTKARKPL